MPDKTTWTSADVAAELSASPFMASLGLEVLSCDPEKGELAIRAPFRPECERFPGTRQWHGGPIAALIDIVGDYAAAIQLGRALPTIDLRIDYLRPAINTDLTFRASVRRSGRTVAVVDVEAWNEKEMLVAIGRCVYATLSADGPTGPAGDRT